MWWESLRIPLIDGVTGGRSLRRDVTYGVRAVSAGEQCTFATFRMASGVITSFFL